MEKSSFENVRIARHQERPYTLDFVGRLFTDFQEVHGDRRFSEDPAIICGFGDFHGLKVGFVGHQKGRNTSDRRYRNFAMPKPEGYRKALRLMLLAEKFGRPVMTFIDTPGAYPGIDAEERGQAEAIATNLKQMARLTVPVVALVIGEGGSGGALAIGVGDVLLMLENSIYSVISPEGCAAILWKSAAESARAAEGLKLTARDLAALGVADEVIPEPAGGAHADAGAVADATDKALWDWVQKSSRMSERERISRRYAKMRALGLLS
ncbi:MAG TPA: acetyl-CoA carboxylase carboxyltransferase subunit alpha [Pyrinomonadaceae bacterium]|nr:acetyl-CoA carboxylase carboxyltransferase subunit alpha [Pyrinomonadaceae bacterium]